MEEDKTLLSYGLSYHSHITLCYNNPNIEIVVKVLEKEEPVLIDCNKTIQDLISVVYNVGVFCRVLGTGQQGCAGGCSGILSPPLFSGRRSGEVQDHFGIGTVLWKCCQCCRRSRGNDQIRLSSRRCLFQRKGVRCGEGGHLDASSVGGLLQRKYCKLRLRVDCLWLQRRHNLPFLLILSSS